MSKRFVMLAIVGAFFILMPAFGLVLVPFQIVEPELSVKETSVKEPEESFIPVPVPITEPEPEPENYTFPILREEYTGFKYRAGDAGEQEAKGDLLLKLRTVEQAYIKKYQKTYDQVEVIWVHLYGDTVAMRVETVIGKVSDSKEVVFSYAQANIGVINDVEFDIH